MMLTVKWSIGGLSPVHTVALHSHHLGWTVMWMQVIYLKTVLNSDSSLLHDKWNARHNMDSVVPLSPELQGGDLPCSPAVGGHRGRAAHPGRPLGSLLHHPSLQIAGFHLCCVLTFCVLLEAASLNKLVAILKDWRQKKINICQILQRWFHLRMIQNDYTRTLHLPCSMAFQGCHLVHHVCVVFHSSTPNSYVKINVTF